MIAIHVQIYLHLVRRVIDVSSLIRVSYKDVLQGRFLRSSSSPLTSKTKLSMRSDKVSRRRIYGQEIAGLTGRRATGKNWLWIYACRQSYGYIRNAIDARRLIASRRFAVVSSTKS